MKSAESARRISLEAAIHVTGMSRRTLWRRVTDGQITRMGSDERGRAMLAYDEVLPALCIDVEDDELELILLADGGDADAQNEIGQLFALQGKAGAALFWLGCAAEQEHAEAMRNLGNMYVAGAGVARDDNAGLMWIARAASQGNAIALAQMSELLSRKGGGVP